MNLIIFLPDFHWHSVYPYGRCEPWDSYILFFLIQKTFKTAILSITMTAFSSKHLNRDIHMDFLLILPTLEWILRLEILYLPNRTSKENTLFFQGHLSWFITAPNDVKSTLLRTHSSQKIIKKSKHLLLKYLSFITRSKAERLLKAEEIKIVFLKLKYYQFFSITQIFNSEK